MTQPLSPNLLPIVTAPGPASGESGTGDPMAFSRELHRELQRDALSATRRTNGSSESLRKPTTESRTDPSAPPRKIERERERDNSARTSSERSRESPQVESERFPQNKSASAPQQPESEADANASERETDAFHDAGAASGPVAVVEDAPQLPTDLAEAGGEVAEDSLTEDPTPAGEELVPQPPVVAAVVDESATTSQDAEIAVKETATTQARSTPVSDVAAEAETQGDGEQQGGKSDQESAEKASPRGTTEIADPSATGEPTSDRQAGVSGSITGATENSALAPSAMSNVDSLGLVSPVEDASTPTETVETPQSTDAPKEARPVTAPLSHRLNSTLLTGQQPASEETEPRGQVDPSRFVNRVSRAFQAAEQRGGVVQLRLSPPELGAMRIELSVQQGVLSARLETETPAAKSVLLDNLPALRERLAAMDIRVDKFDVDVQQEGSSKQDNWQSEQQGGDRRQSRPPETATSTPRATDTGMLSADDIPRPNLPLNGRLNVIA